MSIGFTGYGHRFVVTIYMSLVQHSTSSTREKANHHYYYYYYYYYSALAAIQLAINFQITLTDR